MQKKENSFKTLIRILNVIKGKKRYLFVLLLLQSFFAITTVGYAFFLRNIIDSAVSANIKGIHLNVIGLSGLAVFQFVLRLFIKFFDEFSRSNLENVIKKRLFDNILIRNFSAVSAKHTGEWLNRLTSDTVIIADGLVSIFPGIFATLIKIITAAVFLFVLIPKFAFFVMIGGLFLILFTWFIRKILKKLHLNVQLADDKLKVFFTEHITALTMVKAYNKEEDSLNLSNELMLNHKKARMKKSNFSNIATSTFSLLINTVQVLAALYCGTSIITGNISFGTFTAVMQLISLIQAPISSVSGYLPRFYAMLASAERIFEIEKFNKDNYENEFDLIEFYNNDFSELVFENVDFSYTTQNGENKVFNDFNLKINKGDFVAFAGDSGCGKSTTLKLLLSLYNINKGSIDVRGNNETYQLNSGFRGLFAYVPQGNMLMNGTIAQVISFNSTSYDLEKLNKALEISCSAEFVNELPLGVNTPLGERGAGLSEGQMQRIAIARAIYSEKPILLLDEATSALDAATEEKLLNKLKNMTNKTVVIVTHRAGVLSAVNKTVKFVLKEDVNNDK